MSRVLLRVVLYSCGGLMGLWSSLGGITFREWQFWAILITMVAYGVCLSALTDSRK